MIYKIKTFTNQDLNMYSIEKKDYILQIVKPKLRRKFFSESFITNEWLISSLAKRMLFEEIYGDLLIPSSKRLKILDVGGGVKLAQKIIANNYDYTVMDIFNHDKKKNCENFFKMHGIKSINTDWFLRMADFEKFDLIIANDLFPNVDQRLDDFLQIVYNSGASFRILLTFYDNKFYSVKRVDQDEHMSMKSWNLQNVKDSLKNSLFQLKNEITISLDNASSTLFSNNRRLALFKSIKNN
jgi:hypothetical protein